MTNKPLSFLIKKFHYKITPTDILHFFQQLSTLTSSGITLMQSLSILMQAQEKKGFCLMIRTIEADLETGRELNQCLLRHPLYFKPFYCRLIQIGEQTGTLNLMLKQITTHQEKNTALQNKIKQALLYPTIILSTAITTTLTLLLFVVPHFAALFANFPQKLPVLTQFIIYLSLLLHKIGLWVVFLFAGMLFFMVNAHQSPSFTILYERYIFHIPILRSIIKKIILIRLTRNLAVILEAGIPLSEALVMISQLTKYKKITAGILRLHAGVHSGKPFHSVLRRDSFFPPLLIQMIRTGEESGTLSKMLKKFTEIYETTVDQHLTTFSQLLEPLIIIILGVLIGGIVIAMYLPIFRLGTVIS